MQERPILITSASLDEHAYGPVTDILERKGFEVVVYRTDKVLSGEEHLELRVAQTGSLSIRYDNHDISPDNVAAAWYRKLGNFFQDIPTDRAKQLYINNEITYLHDTIWPLYPQSVWLNAPDKIRRADRKIGQLITARDVGFSIPETIISSHWDDVIQGLLGKKGQQVALKTVRGIISEKEALKALYTTVLSGKDIESLRNNVSPFPGIYQPFIGKYREWRVTVVGKDIFPVSIYTNQAAKDDWRKLQDTNAVEFRSEELPEAIKEKCIRYLGRVGLRFGAFDFIETADEETIFLECNPNGQYGWLERELGLPISQAIANELAIIANDH